MNPRTRFLSRLFGLYCLAMAIAMALHRDTFLETIASLVHDRPLVFIVGVITVFAGLAMILAHNLWRGGALVIVVTVIGWITLLKGGLFLLLSPNGAVDFYLGTLDYAGRYYGYAALTAVLGLYLAVSGFRAERG